MPTERQQKVVITGATGFLGGALARRLATRERFDKVLGTGRNEVAGRKLAKTGVGFVAADLTDRQAVMALCEDADTVVHSAALASPWGPDSAFRDANVVATRNVVDACLKNNVRRLVHISTPSIYFNFTDRLGIRESEPLPTRMLNAYARTKLEAEKIVDRGAEAGLRGISLRPRGIFGPGDTNVLPRLIRALEAGRLPIVGNGENVLDLTYIDNVVDAIIASIDAPDAVCGGKFNITNGEPIRLWPLVTRLAKSLGLQAPNRRVPYRLVMAVAGGMEAFHRLARPNEEPVLTRYTVGILGRTMTLDITAARRDLGYRPRVTMDEGIERFLAWWKAKVA